MLPKRTTKANINEHKKCITVDDLSRTFQDAVHITRQLGFRYLWIDSLCIVQDDNDDWTREAQKMPDIYGGSVLTLAALSSADGSYGCRTGTNGKEHNSSWRRIDHINERCNVRFFEQKPKYWYREYGDDPYKHESFGLYPLRTRAWTLQERELSARSVHFSSNMLLWQCQTMKGSSELPWSEIEPMDDFQPMPVHNVSGGDLRGSSALLRSRWFNLVEDYTSRFMSRESDKLPAILGLAIKYSENFQIGQYVAGIFVAHMPPALMWRVKPQDPGSQTAVLSAFRPRRPMKRRAPSWSWAAIDGEVTYDSQRLTGTVSMASVQSPKQSYFGLVSSVEPISSLFRAGELSIVEDAALLVNARVVPLCSEVLSMYRTLPLAGGSINLVSSNGSVAGAFFPDISLETRSVSEIFCLEVCREPYWSEVDLPHHLQISQSQLASEEEFDKNPMIMGLAIVPDEDGKGVYKRLGLVRWIARSLFHGVEPVKLTIV